MYVLRINHVTCIAYRMKGSSLDMHRMSGVYIQMHDLYNVCTLYMYRDVVGTASVHVCIEDKPCCIPNEGL